MPQVVIGTISPGVPTHVVISYRPGELACYMNGKRLFVPPLIDGDFSNCTPQSLVFGDEINMARNRAGRIENIAIYSRFMHGEEAADNLARIAEAIAERETCRLIIEDFDAHPQLQGERLVMDQDDFTFPCFTAPDWNRPVCGAFGPRNDQLLRFGPPSASHGRRRRKGVCSRLT